MLSQVASWGNQWWHAKCGLFSQAIVKYTGNGNTPLLVPLYKDGIKIQCYMKLLTGRIQNLDRTRLDQPVPIHTYINKLYLSSDFSVATWVDPNHLVPSRFC